MQKRIEEPGFWDNPEASQQVMKELKNLQDSVEQIEQLYSDYEDMSLLIEMSEEDADEETVAGIQEELEQFESRFEELRISTLLTGPYDRDNAIVTLHAGAGGTESCDWTNMLYRMYTRWAEKKNYSVEVLDYLEGDVAGIKGVTFQVNGENAYGYLRSEQGVHRLVRISPFNAAGKRQTSFVSCDVISAVGRRLLQICGCKEEFWDGSRELMRLEPDVEDGIQIGTDLTAYVLRRDFASRAANVCGATDQELTILVRIFSQ